MSPFTTTTTIATALLAMSVAQSVTAAALPSTSTVSTIARVQAVTAVVPAANPTALAPVPSDVAADVHSFLDKYQPDAHEASLHATAAGLDGFPNEGLCTQSYPCFSVSRVGLVKFDSAPSFAIPQMDALLKAVLARDEITLDQASNPQTILSGTKLATADFTLEVIAPAGTISAARLAGTVFDLFKAQGLQATSNAVRGMGVGGGSDGKAPMALCVFPSGAEGKAASNFCYGKELDGTLSATSTDPTPGLERRFSILGIAAGLCSLIDIPLICPKE